MIRRALILSWLLFPLLGFAQYSQQPGWSDSQAGQIFSPEQLDNLVAPIALYPDQLLSQVLAASTYPAEVADAQRWLQVEGNLPGPELIDAARQQNWDPSVQALVAFPSVLNLLNRDLEWTTDLGNAFLGQQVDVMNAVQRMRERARENGRLAPSPQQNVTTETQDGQSVIQIQPADPQVIYVPAYNPAFVWGSPAWGAYPALPYPDVGSGFSWGPAALIGTLFSGLLHWGGWGWALSWFTHGLFLNPLFFSHFGFGGYGGFGGGHGPVLWAHNPNHRMGVPYSSRELAGRYHGGFGRGNLEARGGWNRFGPRPAASDGWHSFGRGEAYRGAAAGYRSPGEGYRASTRDYSRDYRTSGQYRGAQQGFRGFSHSGMGQAESASRGAGTPRSWERASGYGETRAASSRYPAPRSFSGSSFSSSSRSGSSR